jgi:hypothetical protein
MRTNKDLNRKFISAKIEHFGGSNPHKIIRKLNPNPGGVGGGADK